MNKIFWLFGVRINILVEDEAEGTGFDLVEGLFPPSSQSPVHIHAHYSETLYCLEGELSIFVPDQEHILTPGDHFFIKAGVPHAVVNKSSEKPFRALAVAHPGGFAKLIRAVGLPESEESKPPTAVHDMVVAGKVMQQIGDSIIGPPGARP